MNLPIVMLVKYKYILLYTWVLVEQAGVPLPSAPVLMAAGALSAQRQIDFLLALATGTAAALTADTIWFFAGRKYGSRVMRLVNKMSLHPPTCVHSARDSFHRRGSFFLIFAKFVPGVSLIAPPIAGQYGMAFGIFLLLDGTGSMVWVVVLLASGRYFGGLISESATILHWTAHFAGALIILAIAGFLLARIYRRHAVLRSFIASPLEPQELKWKLDHGEAIAIVDLRHPLELLSDPFTLPGALHISPLDFPARQGEIPRGREIILYCTCPSEATAARTALMLRKHCIEQVRPLRGGFDEWKRLGYPLDPIPPAISSSVSTPTAARKVNSGRSSLNVY
jgi:membrane protein DedA with SNARE-associated domain/rhodanese-related sulfurtransferase